MKNKYNYFVSEIGNQIIKSVNNNLSFRNNFKDMAVEVKSLDARQTFARIISDTNCKYVMEIYIDPKDSEEYIKFIIAHELAHLLFCKSKSSNYCSKNFDKTNLVQKVSKDVKYGRGIGEILCNYVALQILFRIYKGKYEVFEVLNIVCKMHPDIINQSRYYFSQKIIDIFGMMVVSDIFDEVCYNGTSRNELLHAAITDTMEQFIEKYDKFMGMNSWRMLNEDIDFYYAAHTNCEYRNIISEISRYKRITNKNLEYNKKGKSYKIYY